MDIHQQIVGLAREARAAAQAMAGLGTDEKNRLLVSIATRLRSGAAQLKQENQKDLAEARRSSLSAAMIDRLTLSDRVIADMAAGLEEVARLPDPVGAVARMWRRPNGLLVGRVRIPLGVVGIIYESRPNVTIDAAGLCLKSGNAVILRGGKEAIHSNLALAGIVQDALAEHGLPRAAAQVVPITDRPAGRDTLKQKECIDVIIPRGGESLIRTVYENSQIPVIAHYKGVCHVYIDESADPAMAERITLNAKVQRPGVCNAMETLLVHEAFASRNLARLLKPLQDAGVRIRGCPTTCSMVGGLEQATEQDWFEEYLDLILAVRVVASLDDAVRHIITYGSKHTDAIVTASYANAQRFLQAVDSSVVLVNASTRFNDGNQLGLGAEIGISTSKLHAFGPMGLEELTTFKFIVYGDGQIRE